ncbi:Rne/Rng family ribonuclease [Reyranella soli]|uniref:Ribonuclease E n=1 Tax=Reyranella soli TaxID=1230389 RepID=A0A512N402_9HYPH|nr:ribonuclease E/G [Reyranella soli]GEP53718.1 ribonuclease E [Reyranella soli]
MARRMLIDASHPEETRVVVVDGTRLEEFDFETATRKPLKGNIYLAKVIRIEPSLQAAFVEYGGNRHGFLAFSEIHPDYYQIPVADRERLIAEQHRLQAEAEDDEPRRRDRIDRTDIEEVREDNRIEIPAESVASEPPAKVAVEAIANAEDTGDRPVADQAPAESLPPAIVGEPEPPAQPAVLPAAIVSERIDGPAETTADAEPQPIATPAETPDAPPATVYAEAAAETPVETSDDATAEAPTDMPTDMADAPQPEVTVETLGGDDVIEQRETRERRRRNPIRQYKIQEVIKRRQILLVQVVKEERGNKGAALTTYLSLAGRYCVLMPNAGRGGGISRKISNPADRKRMKEVLSELDVPQGQGVILRTAGLERSTIDIKRDYEYLSRLWDSIREITMRSTAPALIYEEGDLIKRSLRDVYDTDIAQVLVEGEAGFDAAAAFMRQLVPHQASKVELYKEPIPLFHRYQVENQFDAMHSPVVQLRSGGYIVINPTEALVAIDVNSGRSTKERNIEETALRTNIEAAEEIARQVRLRDLAGLIVIDFIDMEETRHQRQVEHKVKDAMRHDRARIQIGRISAFGLLEMSRQRLRPSLLEHSTETCPHCAGTGRIRSIESAALHALRTIEEEGVRRRAGEIIVSVPPNVALYLLNQKRHTLSEIERRYGFSVTIEADDELHAADCEIERVRSRRDDRERPGPELARASYEEVSEEAQADEADVGEDREAGERIDERGEREDGDREGGRRRRRRRRRRGGRRDEDGDSDRPQAMGSEDQADQADAGHGTNGAADELHDRQHDEPHDGPHGERDEEPVGDAHADGEGERSEERADDRDGGDRRRRRGRRGGRRRRRENGEGEFSDHQGGEHGEAAVVAAPLPIEGNPVEHMAEGHMPVEHAPYDASAPVAPPVNVEAAPPPPLEPPAPPIVVAAAPQPEPPPPPPPPPAVPVIDAPPEKPKRGWWRR